jgi:hypothetical protein
MYTSASVKFKIKSNDMEFQYLFVINSILSLPDWKKNKIKIRMGPTI